MEQFRASHQAIQERLAGLDQRNFHDQGSAFNEEVNQNLVSVLTNSQADRKAALARRLYLNESHVSCYADTYDASTAAQPGFLNQSLCDEQCYIRVTKGYFLEEVRRIENRLRDGLRISMAATATDAASSSAEQSSSPSPLSPGAGRVVDGNPPSILAVSEDDVRRYLDKHRDSVRLEAVATVQRHRDHLATLRRDMKAG